jgi:signal transduction histidine kinase
MSASESLRLAADRIAAALSPWSASVRLVLPDRTGRLRQVVSIGEGGYSPGRKRSARRRTAYESGEPVLIGSSDRETVFALLPLSAGKLTVGVVEIVAPPDALAARRSDLETAVSREAVTVSETLARQDSPADVDSIRAADLARQVVGASTPRAVLRSVLTFYFERFDAPIAAWLAEGHQGRVTLVGVRGLGVRRGKALRANMRSLPRWESLSTTDRRALTERFRSIAGTEGVSALHVGDALLLAAAGSFLARRSLATMASLLEDALDHVVTVEWAARRNEALERGLACTAHELKSPIATASLAIERVLSRRASAQDSELLRQSKQGLDLLAETVDSLLRWSIGDQTVKRRPVNLVRVTRQAIDSCTVESGPGRVTLDAPPTLLVRGESHSLRSAIGNLIRNAIVYSPPESTVGIVLRRINGRSLLSVHDRGPGIPPWEAESIFDPYVRGEWGQRSRQGVGLGLFIARRVAEAHGGKIWAESRPGGASFHLLLESVQTPWPRQESAS